MDSSQFASICDVLRLQSRDSYRMRRDASVVAHVNAIVKNRHLHLVHFLLLSEEG